MLKIVCFGDSITAQSWPDYLALRMFRDDDSRLAVIRRGIGGSRVLRRYDYLKDRHYGDNGLTRFPREIDSAGVDRVIVLHGINDIIHPGTGEFRPWEQLPKPEDLIGALKEYIRMGHKAGKKVYIATIPTIKGWTGYRAEREAVRHAVNEWIRTNKEADGFIEFDGVTRSNTTIPNDSATVLIPATICILALPVPSIWLRAFPRNTLRPDYSDLKEEFPL